MTTIDLMSLYELYGQKDAHLEGGKCLFVCSLNNSAERHLLIPFQFVGDLRKPGWKISPTKVHNRMSKRWELFSVWPLFANPINLHQVKISYKCAYASSASLGGFNKGDVETAQNLTIRN